MKNILIFGAHGFLGKHIFHFIEKNYNDYYIAAPTSAILDLLNYFEFIRFQELESIKNVKFDYIFNCAIYFKPGDFKSHADMYIYNQIMNDNFLRYIKEYQQQATIITFGTDAAYPEDRKSEDWYLGEPPQSDYCGYAWSKKNLYVGLILLNNQYNIKFFHFPLISLYGSGYKKDDNHLIHDIIRKIIRTRYHNEEAVFFGDGSQIREITYINDLVNNIFKIINNENNIPFPHIVNLGSDNKRKTIKEYVQNVCDYLEYDFNKVVFDVNATKGSSRKTLNNSLITSHGNYSDTKFEDTLKDIVDYSLTLYK